MSVAEKKPPVLRAVWIALLDTVLILIALLSGLGVLALRGDGPAPICFTIAVAALAVIERLR